MEPGAVFRFADLGFQDDSPALILLVAALLHARQGVGLRHKYRLLEQSLALQLSQGESHACRPMV